MGKRTLTEIDTRYGKVPPQAIELEEAILGALMLERDAITKVELLPEVFYKDEHQKIFEVIQKLDNENTNIDLLVVTQRIKEEGLLDEIGGPAYITQLTRRVASAAHIEQHAKNLIEYYVRRELIRVSNEILNLSYDTSNDLADIMDLYEKAVADIDRVLIGKHTGRELIEVLKDLTDEVERRTALSKEGGLTGINTGFGRLNEKTSGWQPTWLIVFAARPAMGKTAIAINRFAKEAAKSNKWVNIFSLEMDDISLAERLVIGASGIDTYKFRNGQLEREDWEKYNKALGELERLPIFIDDSPYVKVSHIRNVARSNKRKNKCDMIIIDYLQLANAGANGNKNREQEVGEMSRRLKELAKELKIPIIVLSQLSREPERRTNKRPVLSDLRESGSIEQDADMVIFPFRPSVYLTDETQKKENEGKGALIVAKNRHGGIGDVKFYYNETMTDFSDEPFDSERYKKPESEFDVAAGFGSNGNDFDHNNFEGEYRKDF